MGMNGSVILHPFRQSAAALACHSFEWKTSKRGYSTKAGRTTRRCIVRIRQCRLRSTADTLCLFRL
jgi:hypothetical protein